MSLKKKLENAMEKYVGDTLLPVCYEVLTTYLNAEEMISYEEFIEAVRIRLKGEKENG